MYPVSSVPVHHLNKLYFHWVRVIPVWMRLRQLSTYEIRHSVYQSFKKDLKLAKKQNKNLDKLFEVIDILANGGTLDAKYRDHDLTGNYKGTRECHIEPDWLLIYEIQNNVLVLMLYRLGTHSELFKK